MSEKVTISDGRMVTVGCEGSIWTIELLANSGEIIDTFIDNTLDGIPSVEQKIAQALNGSEFQVGLRSPKGASWLRERGVNKEEDLLLVARLVTNQLFGLIAEDDDTTDSSTQLN